MILSALLFVLPDESLPRPVTLAPVEEQITLGTLNSGGNLASWAADDGNVRNICKFFNPAMPSPFAQIRLRFDTGTTAIPKSLEFRVKASYHTPGPQAITLLLRRPNGLEDQTTVSNEPLIEGMTYVGLPLFPLENYVTNTGQIWTVVEAWRRGPSTSFYPCASFEFANLVLTY